MNRFAKIYSVTKDIRTVRKPLIRLTWRSSIPSSDQTAPTGPTNGSDRSDRGWLGWRIIRVRGHSMCQRSTTVITSC